MMQRRGELSVLLHGRLFLLRRDHQLVGAGSGRAKVDETASDVLGAEDSAVSDVIARAMRSFAASPVRCESRSH